MYDIHNTIDNSNNISDVTNNISDVTNDNRNKNIDNNICNIDFCSDEGNLNNLDSPANIPECLICLEHYNYEYESDSDYEVLIDITNNTIFKTHCNCKYFVHEKCISQWIKQTPKCPLCDKVLIYNTNRSRYRNRLCNTINNQIIINNRNSETSENSENSENSETSENSENDERNQARLDLFRIYQRNLSNRRNEFFCTTMVVGMLVTVITLTLIIYLN